MCEGKKSVGGNFVQLGAFGGICFSAVDVLEGARGCAQALPSASNTVPSVNAMLRVRWMMRPLPVSVPRAGRMNEVFISIVTTPTALSTLRAAVASVTSNSVITAPPWVTLKEFRCSGAGV